MMKPYDDNMFNFNFDWNRAPINSLSYVAIFTILYVSIVLSYSNLAFVRNLLRFQNQKLLNSLISGHNLILSLGSLCIFIGVVYEVAKRTYIENSYEWIFCESPQTKAVGMLWFWSYVYYLSKYYELLDTLLQFLNNKTPPNFFLHTYHHSLVILMSWAWIEYQASTQFIGIAFNTAVHVIMYYYYYLKSIGITPKWKSYVTKFQIVQFMFSLLVITICYYYAISRYLINDTVKYPMCKGMPILTSSLVFNSTLLIGFFGVLKSNSSSSNSKDAKSKANKKN